MSRIGKKPVAVPKGVTVLVSDGTVTVKGPKGQLQRTFPPGVEVRLEGDHVVCTRAGDEPAQRARHGLVRSLVANMVRGVTEGYVRELEISGVGYKAELTGGELRLVVGHSHPDVFPLPEGVQARIDKQRIVLTGIDREVVGRFASQVRACRPPDPYKLKGVKYAGEIIKKKVGKTGAA
jgi:large subunit ribosomal protein L6